MMKTEYNKTAKLNPLDGYSFSVEDNKKLAEELKDEEKPAPQKAKEEKEKKEESGGK